METLIKPAPAVAVPPSPGYDARPLSWRTGSEVLGLDLRRSADIPEPTIRALWQLLGERGILLFRNQQLDHEQHLDFTRRFGPLAQTGLLGKHAPPGYPDIFMVTNIKTDGRRSETENAAQPGNDGLVILPDGTKYVSSVQNGGVSRIRSGRPAELIARNIPSAASMCYDAGAKQLVIPLNANNGLAFIKLD